MHITKLRRVGGSVMMAVPPALLDLVDLHAGSAVDIVVSHGHLEIRPLRRPQYTLAELLAASDYSAPMTEEERDWIDAPAVGRELI